MTKTLTDLWNKEPSIISIRPTKIYHCNLLTVTVIDQSVNEGYVIRYKKRIKCDIPGQYNLKITNSYYIGVAGDDWTVYVNQKE